ncbi:MAG: LytTR family DNA-binding domain-containing protein [Saprospiraceae bacterium]
MLEAYSNDSHILTAGKKLLTSKTLKHWAAKINHPYFIRTHHSFLVNKFHIMQIDKCNKLLTLQDGKVIPVSRDFTDFEKVVKFEL